MITLMLLEATPFEKVWSTLHSNSPLTSKITAFVRFMERRLGARFLFNKSTVPYGDIDLQPVLMVAEKLEKNGTLMSLERTSSSPDMPRLYGWRAMFGESDEDRAAGYSAQSERDALVRAIAELIERYVWVHEEKLFAGGKIATESEIALTGPFLALSKIVGLSREQKQNAQRHASTKTYYWIQTTSLVTDKTLWVPAQIIGASSSIRNRIRSHQEPYLRNAITTGMATHVSQKEARLSGILETIERDAYVIMWLNQLSCRKLDLSTLPASTVLKNLLSDCERYGLNVHAVQMPTDAPTHAICVVLEDMLSKNAPYSLGMKAGAHISDVIEGALVEALRAHGGALAILQSNPDMVIQKKDVTHRNRPLYYATGGRKSKLSFLVAGPTQKYVTREWDTDSVDLHYDRLIQWFKESSYECISFSYTKSGKNVTPWHIEMTIMPEFQPLYFTEKSPQASGERISSVPLKLGYTPREKPFLEEPHPFA